MKAIKMVSQLVQQQICLFSNFSSLDYSSDDDDDDDDDYEDDEEDEDDDDEEDEGAKGGESDIKAASTSNMKK